MFSFGSGVTELLQGRRQSNINMSAEYHPPLTLLPTKDPPHFQEQKNTTQYDIGTLSYSQVSDLHNSTITPSMKNRVSLPTNMKRMQQNALFTKQTLEQTERHIEVFPGNTCLQSEWSLIAFSLCRRKLGKIILPPNNVPDERWCPLSG